MKKLGILLIISLTFVACESKRTFFPRSMDEISVSLIRFDQALMNVSSVSAYEDICVLYDEYPTFMTTFVEEIIGIPSADTAYLAQALPAFLADTLYGFNQTNALEREIFGDVSEIEDELSRAFTRVHYLYPEWQIPALYLFVSGFNASIYFAGEDIAIGADMYLGSDYEYYNQVVYDYQRITMRKECIPVDVVSAYLFKHIGYTSDKSRLIDNMIYRGKVLYILSQIFDYLPPYEVMGYTEEQWNWCERNEKGIWNLMMDKRDLFKTENLVLTSYLNDGPFTAEISQDSPGRLGTWIGWRIAESYMNNNDSISIQQLATEADAEYILQNSYYRP